MKLETNMYVRTPYGIRKIKKITKDDGYGKPRVKVIELDWLLHTNYKFDYIFYTDEKIIKQSKASHNIIDLIEEKDLLEIEYYSPRYEERVTRLFEVDFKHKNNITFGNVHCQLNIFDGEWDKHDQLLEPAIKTIVTKEQFESISYRIGE